MNKLGVRTMAVKFKVTSNFNLLQGIKSYWTEQGAKPRWQNSSLDWKRGKIVNAGHWFFRMIKRGCLDAILTVSSRDQMLALRGDLI